MHTRRFGLILGFFLLTLVNLKDFTHGKAFPEDNDEGKYKLHYNQKLKPQFHRLYNKKNLPPKLYYTPHINGQPIYLPDVGGSVIHASKLLGDRYERNKQYTRSWTFTTPVSYDYDHNQKDYYEDSVTSNSMVKKLLGDKYEKGVHRGDYHILSTTPENYEIYESKQTNKNFKNKGNKYLRKKDKKRKNKDFHGFSKYPISVKHEDETVASDYAPEVVQVTGEKLSSDHTPEEVLVSMKLPNYDYASEVDDKEFPDYYDQEEVGPKFPDYSPEQVDDKEPFDYSPEQVIDKKLLDTPRNVETNSKLSDDYSPEVVKVIGSKISDDYSPEVVKVIGSKISDDYSPEVVKVIGSKISDDYSPEVVKSTGTKFTEDKVKGDKFPDSSPEIIEVVNMKNHKTEQLYPPKKKLVLKNTGDKHYDEVTSQEPFASKKEKTKGKIDKSKKESSGSEKVDLEVDNKFANKKSDKLIHKKQSQVVKKKTYDSNLYLVTKKPILKPITMNSDKLNHDSKADFYDKSDDDLKSSHKMKPTAKSAPKDEYGTDEIHKTIKEKDDIVTDFSKSPLSERDKTSSTHESKRDFSEDISTEKSEILHSRDLLKEETFSDDESIEGFDLESPGSGDLVNEENISRGSLFHNTDFIRSLSTLNSNIWSLIFNPNAEFKKVKKCVTRNNETGFCMYVQQCDVPNVVTSLEQLLNDACVIDDIFIGICCPEFPVQSVKVHWEQMPSGTDKRTDDEFSHKSEDCGVRSSAASKAQSWPWKAPLVSMSNGMIFCDGVLIKDNYVLTAAHCTTKIPKNQILVRLGQHDDSSGEDFAVVEIKRHARYSPRSMRNDIALLKLGRRIVHDEHTNIICIPEDDDHDNDDHDDDEDDHAGERAILLGSRGSFSINFKKDEHLEVMTNKDCEKKLGVKVPVTMLCTEARDENERTCNTDSGAPLVIKDDDKYEVIGILSWNRNDCDQRYPSIFSRVSRYIRWIKKHTV